MMWLAGSGLLSPGWCCMVRFGWQDGLGCVLELPGMAGELRSGVVGSGVLGWVSFSKAGVVCHGLSWC